MSRASDKGTAEKVKSNAPPCLIFFDGDGEEFHRSQRISKENTAADVEAAMKEALQKYAPREISWASGSVADTLAAAKEQRKLVALVFLEDGKEASQKFVGALQDRWLAKLQDRLLFVKAMHDDASESSQEWGVSSAPTLLLVDPLAAADGERKKCVLERVTGEKAPGTLRGLLLRALARFEKSLGK